MKQHLHVQAHRGASLEAYENTVESILQAVELGAHSVECDIHLLKDHHCVVFHDFFIKPQQTTHCSVERFISHLTWSELQAVQWKEPRLKIPLLQEVLVALKKIKVPQEFWLDCELKYDIKNVESPTREAILNHFMSCIETFWSWNHTVVRSFDWELLDLLAVKNPNIRRIPLVDRRNPDFLGAQKISTGWIAPPKEIVTEAQVLALKKSGFQLMVYTANESHEWQRLLDLGVEGITTDDPRGLLKYVQHQANA
ncbi:glycerophosphodiester phosphodiesterase [bacterium]|nr:glycerophosphodiester phosphodiesterase [bacterium]NBW98177.1 glycerophosphodiester phosphodiesterase [bacterium]NBX82679.1 glycerophosphodiester phosphodiesterase [bacterium]